MRRDVQDFCDRYGLRVPILLAFLSSRGDAEIYLLALGEEESEGTLVMEDAEPIVTSSGFWLLEDGRYRGPLQGKYGSFVPGLDRLLIARLPAQP